MKVIVCEVCDCRDLVKSNGLYVCQNCGAKYTPEEAKKLLIDVPDAPDAGNSGSHEKYAEARSAFDKKQYSKANRLYEQLQKENPDDWQPRFYNHVSKIMLYPRDSETIFALIDDYDTILSSIPYYHNSPTFSDSCNQMLDALLNLTETIHGNAKNEWLSKENEQDGYQNGREDAYAFSIKFASNLLKKFGDKLEEIYGAETSAFSVSAWKKAILFIGDSYNIAHQHEIPWKETMREIEAKIQKYESDYKLPEDSSFGDSAHNRLSGNTGCYIATAVYGTYDCPQLWTLRRYRDYTLAKTWYGRAFISSYYAISPTLVKWFGGFDWCKKTCKAKLDSIVLTLNKNGVADTPYHDRNW